MVLLSSLEPFRGSFIRSLHDSGNQNYLKGTFFRPAIYPEHDTVV